MKLLMSLVLVCCMGCETWEKQKEREKRALVEINTLHSKIITSVILRTQDPEAGWNKVRPMTYVKIVSTGTLLDIRGLWGDKGDTIRQPYLWYVRQGAKGSELRD